MGSASTTPTPPFLTGLSADRRYLVDQFGKPFLVNADSAFAAAINLDPAGQETYLADRARNGFNTIITSLVGESWFSSRGNASNWNGDLPFTSGYTPNPAYWSKIDAFLALCHKYGISVFLSPIDAYGTVSPETFYGMTNAQAFAYGAFLAARYPQASYPGIVWMMGGDYAGDGVGNGTDINFDSQYQAMLSGMASMGDTRLYTTELGYYESLSTDSSTWASLVGVNAAYSYHPTYEVILRARAANDIPVVFTEGAYENAGSGYAASPLDLRKETLWSMTSGAAGTFYGNSSLDLFPSGWQSQLDTSDVAQQKAINAALDGITWWKLAPDTGNHLVTAGRNNQFTAWSTANPPLTDDATYGWYVTAAYAADGTQAVIYNPDTSMNHITISSAILGANPTITAVDPTDGATTRLGWTTTPTMGANAAGDHDWLFIINATAG